MAGVMIARRDGDGLLSRDSMTTSFLINISGTPISTGGYDILVKQLQKRIEIFSPGAEINIYNFAGLNKRLEITGEITFFQNIDNFVKSMKLYIERQLKFWMYTVQVSYVESSVESGK